MKDYDPFLLWREKKIRDSLKKGDVKGARIQLDDARNFSSQQNEIMPKGLYMLRKEVCKSEYIQLLHEAKFEIKNGNMYSSVICLNQALEKADIAELDTQEIMDIRKESDRAIMENNIKNLVELISGKVTLVGGKKKNEETIRYLFNNSQKLAGKWGFDLPEDFYDTRNLFYKEVHCVSV